VSGGGDRGGAVRTGEQARRVGVRVYN